MTRGEFLRGVSSQSAVFRQSWRQYRGLKRQCPFYRGKTTYFPGKWRCGLGHSAGGRARRPETGGFGARRTTFPRQNHDFFQEMAMVPPRSRLGRQETRQVWFTGTAFGRSPALRRPGGTPGGAKREPCGNSGGNQAGAKQRGSCNPRGLGVSKDFSAVPRGTPSVAPGRPVPRLEPNRLRVRSVLFSCEGAPSVRSTPRASLMP